jgi:hypothetical protein
MMEVGIVPRMRSTLQSALVGDLSFLLRVLESLQTWRLGQECDEAFPTGTENLTAAEIEEVRAEKVRQGRDTVS